MLLKGQTLDPGLSPGVDVTGAAVIAVVLHLRELLEASGHSPLGWFSVQGVTQDPPLRCPTASTVRFLALPAGSRRSQLHRNPGWI